MHRRLRIPWRLLQTMQFLIGCVRRGGAVFIFCFSAGNAAVISVHPTGHVQTIAAAIEQAVSGDTIRVSAGRYEEYGLHITNRITLVGQGWPVIDARGQGPILELSTDGASVSGFVLCGVPVSFVKEHAAILVNNSTDCEIRGNRFTDNFFAIYLAKSRYCRILDNEITGVSKELTSVGNGIHLWNCSDIDVTHNVIRGHRDGIYLEFVTNSVIVNNTSEQNLRYGLHFMFSDSCRYERNRFLRNGAGVAVMYTDDVEMLENVFEDNWGGASYGLLLKDIKDSRVLDNRFTRNSVGIHMEGSDRVHIERNCFTANGWAIRIMANCVQSVIEQNDFIDNTFQVATNSRQTFSSFSGNYWSPYRGFDLNRDGFGDEPFRPVSLYSLLVEMEPPTLVLVRSLLVDVLNLAERIIPTLTPEALVDNKPRMRPVT
ncbi:MAG: nitrous oxide reductase family maturation protein NosD [Candidatus Zixiibacteriota bacterium]